MARTGTMCSSSSIDNIQSSKKILYLPFFMKQFLGPISQLLLVELELNHLNVVIFFFIRLLKIDY